MKSNTYFEEALTSLNDDQRKAVEQIEGPVLVIAGPGTGKTQVLAARIAHILTATDSLPENILCLTYTDAGTIAMRKRLLQFIGPDAYRVSIFTFHAFCNQVIQENLDFFGLHGLDAVSELEQIEYVHHIIDSFPKNHPLKRYTGDVYYEAPKLLALYETMKRENWTAAFLKEKAEAYINDLPLREEYTYKKDSKYGKKGELKKSLYDAEVKRMAQLIAAAETFDSYQALLKKNNRYDFADMIIWVIEAFKQKPELLNQYQERYLYFLVDEYQDTSGSQNELLELLLTFWSEPNVFCVGDDDQSIYRFQGANVENILQFIKKYSPATITLKDNYRSTQFILDASRALIQQNQNRIAQDKILVAKNENYAALPVKPEIQAYYNIAHEAVGIASDIEELKQKGVKLNEIAVIYRKHAQADDLIKFLLSKDIPVNTRKRIDILQEPFVKKLLSILRYLNAEVTKAHSGEVYIYEVLHYDFFQIDPIEIARISVDVYKRNFSDRSTSWREELKNVSKKKPDLFTSIAPSQKLENASRLIEGWIKDSVNLTVQQLIEQVISQSGMLLQALTGKNKTWNMQLLHTFFDFVKSECSRKPKTTLKQLLETITLMEEEGVALPAQHISYHEEGVNFITAHSSKGLEFEYVYMMGCTNKAWESTSGNFNFKLPDTIFEITTEDESEESRRLFYVAMTRSKKQLILSYPEHDNNGKDIEKSRFVAELETHAELHTKAKQVSDEALIAFELNVLKAVSHQATKDLFDNAFVDELLEKYTLSVTHLNSYLKCPVSFYFNNLIRVPAPLSSSMTFGSAVHFALERLFKNMNQHEQKQFATVEEMLKDFKWYMRRNEDSFTEKDFKRRIEYGEEILPKFYNRYINEWNKITSIERTYRNVVMDGVPLNGKLDKLEFEGNFVNVVDYKTGQYKNAEKKFNRPDREKLDKAVAEGKEKKFEDEFGGDYWRQAVFYKILMDYDQTKTWEMRTSEFDFVEPDRDSGEFYKHRIAITPEDITIVRNQIVTSYRQIKNKEFDKGCEKEDCSWCNFVKEYYKGSPGPSIALINAQEEGVD